MRSNDKFPIKPRTANNCRYAKVYSIDRVWELLSDEVMTSSQVAEKLGCHVVTAYNKLRELLDQGKVTRMKAGGTWVWRKVGTP